MFRSILKSIGSGRTIKRGTFTTTSASFCIDIREPDSGLVAADPQHPICFHLHLFLFHRKTSWCWSWRLWCWSKYFEHLYSVIYRFFWLKEKSCRCVKIRHTCSSPALCSSLVCLAMCEASAGTSSRASLCAHLVISDFWKIANNLIFSFGKEKISGRYVLDVQTVQVCTMKPNERWPQKHCMKFWKSAPSIIFSTLLQYAQHSLFIWQGRETRCTATHPDRHIINPPPKVRRSIPPSGIIERWCSPDDRGAIFLRLWHRSSTKYLYESDFHPSAALTWYGSLQSNKTLHSWPKRIGKSRTA